jgi:ornithine--oxo-acid transaminase
MGTPAHEELTEQEFFQLSNRWVTHNYNPLNVVISSGEGAVLTDVNGTEYLDFLASYSASNFGHGHPGIVNAMETQLRKVALTSRAFHHDQLAPFAEKLARLIGKEMVLPMNTGVEAVESAIKVARKWGYAVKGVPAGMANIIVAHGNFHGRTTTVVSFSDDETARDGFGPFAPGFRSVPFGDAVGLENAIDENTVAVLLEPIQGEAGVIIPPAGYLARVREVTSEQKVLFIAD